MFSSLIQVALMDLMRLPSRSPKARASCRITVTITFRLIVCSMNKPWVSLFSGT